MTRKFAFLLGALSLVACGRTPAPAPADELPPMDADSNVKIERALSGEIRDAMGKSKGTYLFVEARVLVAGAVPLRMRSEGGARCFRLAESPDRFLAARKNPGAVSPPAGEVLRLSTIPDHVDYHSPGMREVCPQIAPIGDSILEYQLAGVTHSVRFRTSRGPTTLYDSRLPASLAKSAVATPAPTTRVLDIAGIDTGSGGGGRTPPGPGSATFDPDAVYLLGVSSADTRQRMLVELREPNATATGFALSGMRATIRPSDGRVIQIENGRASLTGGSAPEPIPARTCSELSTALRAGIEWAAFDLKTNELVQSCNVYAPADKDWVQSIYVDGTYVSRTGAGLTGTVLGPPVGGIFPASGCTSEPGPTPSQPILHCGFALLDRNRGTTRVTGVPRSNVYIVRSLPTGFFVVPLQHGPYELWRVGLDGSANREYVYAPLAGATDGGMRARGSVAIGADGALYVLNSAFVAVGRARDTRVERRDALESRTVYSSDEFAKRNPGKPSVLSYETLTSEIITGGAISYASD